MKYRGINRNTRETLTFDQATLYFPILIVLILYLPSIICTLISSYINYGSRFFMKLMENPVFFLLPLFTSFSFYENDDTIYAEKNRIDIKPSLESGLEMTLIRDFRIRKLSRSLQSGINHPSNTSIIFGEEETALNLHKLDNLGKGFKELKRAKSAPNLSFINIKNRTKNETLKGNSSF